MNTIQKLKQELAKVCDEIYKQNLVELGEGNISIRVPEKNEMIITPAGNDYNNLQPSNMVHMGLDDSVFENQSKPSSEFRMHRSIYLQRPKVQCIIHTHSPFVSTLAILHYDLPVILEEMAIFLGGSVVCTNYCPAGSEELPKEILRTMKEQNATIIANHGVVVVGKTNDYCIRIAVIVEKMAQIYLRAMKIDEIKTISAENQAPFIKIFNEMHSTL